MAQIVGRVRRLPFPRTPGVSIYKRGIFSAARVVVSSCLCWRTVARYAPAIGHGLGISRRLSLAVPRLVLDYLLEMVSPLSHRLAVSTIRAKLCNSLPLYYVCLGWYSLHGWLLALTLAYIEHSRNCWHVPHCRKGCCCFIFSGLFARCSVFLVLVVLFPIAAKQIAPAV